MNHAWTSSVDLLHELFEWCQHARNLYTTASQKHDSAGLRALKYYLAERNAEHLRDLRQLLHGCGGAGAPTALSYRTETPRWGAEIVRDLNSSDRALVLLACGHVEKLLVLAYEKVWRDPALTDASARTVVARHIADLEASQAFVHQIEGERSRPSHTSAGTFATT